ncbi:MAG: hemerythrin domain-containing protein [Ignavibacteriae bacterium]|nr:hemerythrin domain-containing protein [Ignavibacteria bacterium]MBI3363932.1 hemerythrin domain-containing protein [Ignavibacteriota bacterium]
MKRHDSFIPLSREHHDGLLLATRLQQGRNALLRLWSHDLSRQAEYVVRFFDEHLDNHFQTEETFIFPLAQKFFHEEQQPIIQQLLDEHNELRELADFLRNPDEKKLECTLTRFGEILERHIRAEERQLFPICEETFPAEDLGTLGMNIIHRHRQRVT